MSVTNPASEYEALVHVVERVARRFPAVPEDAVVELVADELTRFDAAGIRTYVPLLVEGSVLRTLRSTVATRDRSRV